MMIRKILLFIANSPSRGVALAKILVPIVCVMLLAVISLLGKGDMLPDKFKWINRLLNR